MTSAANIIEAKTGVEVPLQQLKDEARKIIKNPAHDFNTTGIRPSVASKLMSDHGVPNWIRTDADLNTLQYLSKSGPILVGFPGHRVMLDSVVTNSDGTRTFFVVDPGYTQTRRMSESQFSGSYNQNSIVIVPMRESPF